MAMDSLIEQLLKLVIRYVERQALVQKTIHKLRPDLLARDDESMSLNEIIKLAETYRDIPTTGIWKDTDHWHYTIHGRGCRLVNTKTGEPIDWTLPHLNEFYDEWFIIWLYWYIDMYETSNELKKLRDIDKEAIFKLLLELETEGFIRTVLPNHFRLV